MLPRQPVNTWQQEDQVYIYCVNLLFISGGPARLQEFSGGQLSPNHLDRFFDDKAVFYSQALGEESPLEWPSKSLHEKAFWVGQKVQEVNSKLQRYRDINGLTIRWEERILGERPLIVDEVVKQNLSDKISRIFGIDKNSDESDKDYWRRVVREVIARDELSLSLLVWSIISTAVEITQSDYGMSSTFRDIHKLLTTGPLSLEKGDFYCCVVPSSKIVDSQTDDKIAEDSQSMANRMEYNRWHFIPGDVKRDSIPLKRDWFYPPTIPDIATEVDWHHGGHVDAKIHHSLRIPASVVVDGTEYRGSYDIRLLRQSGEPYKPDDIKTAKVYLDVLGNVIQSVVEYVEETGQQLKIGAFTTRWYKNHLWKEYARIASSA
ncbi:MAG: hypothetical protein HYV39_00345 [Candidatus Levybacteria bacterium]|nr:hypothetical protein [Candidatus Levybacteria bacterium]